MIADLFYRHPRLLLLSMGLIIVSGLAAFFVMPRMEDPLLSPRAANVTTRFPGATAERVESLVTEKIEKELEEIPEIKEIRSTSRSGVSFIQIELRDDVTRDTVPAVWSRIRDKVDDAALLMPSGAQAPVFDEVDIKADALIVALRWDHPSPPRVAVLRRLSRQLEERLRRLPGTEKTRLYGDPGEEILVTIDQQQLASLNLNAGELAAQIESSDAKVAAGQLRSASGDLLLEISGEKRHLTDIGMIPIRFGEAMNFVQLADIARIERTAPDPPASLALVDDQMAVAIGALVRADSRIDLWTVRARQTLAEFAEELPPGIALETLFEQNRYVAERLDGLIGNLIAGGLAVTLVVLLMMGWRSAIVVGAALPLASLMVLAGLRWLDIPIHQMSVTGLIVALGLLIDNAIVMVDDVSQRIREGESPSAAIRHSVAHLQIPLLGSTLTTALAFGPIALMPGPAGEFVGTIAISVIIAVGSSFVLAMTIVPALAAWGWRLDASRNHPDGPAAPRTHGRFWQDGWQWPALSRWYQRQLTWLYARPWWGLGLGCLFPILGLIAASRLPEQFFPPADRDVLNVEIELPVTASIEQTSTLAREIGHVLRQDPTVTDVHWFIGESAPVFYYNVIPSRKNQPRYAQAIVQRNTVRDAESVIHRLQSILDARFPQALPLVRQLEQGPPFYAPVEVRLFGPDLDQLRTLGEEVRLILSQTPQVIHTRSELAESLPKLHLQVDEAAARYAGLSPVDVARQFEVALDGAVGGSIVESTEELKVRVRVQDQQRAGLAEILGFNLRRPQASPEPLQSNLPLLALAKLELLPEVSGIPRFNHRRMNEVQAFIPAGVLPAKVLHNFQARLHASGFSLPPGYELEWGGEAAKRDDAIGNLLANVGVLMVLMVATLVLSFQSFRLASLIGLVGGLSMGLGTGALWLYGYPFGFMAIVGTMGLVGVAINDSIVVLAGIREHAAAREGDPQAMQQVVSTATRHILSTSLTTMAGFLPLILAGGGFWPPLAVAISGGVFGATLLALIFVPCCYLIVFRPRPRFGFQTA